MSTVYLDSYRSAEKHRAYLGYLFTQSETQGFKPSSQAMTTKYLDYYSTFTSFHLN